MTMTLKEYMKINPPKCNKCSNLVGIDIKSFGTKKTHILRDLDGNKVKGLYCNECVDIAEAELMNSRFAETYKGHSIFCKDGNYVPYWGASYYFKTLEECRNRIDAKHVAVLPWGLVNL